MQPTVERSAAEAAARPGDAIGEPIGLDRHYRLEGRREAAETSPLRTDLADRSS
jgi:hypothetical protein